MERSYIIFAALLILSVAVYAQLSGPLNGTISSGIYIVEGDISVEAGDSLNIEPGTMLKFGGDYGFVINGYLYAVGTETDSIIFLPDAGVSYWAGIDFYNAADDSSRLGYSLITGGLKTGAPDDGGGGIYLEYSCPTISHCTISQNTAPSGGGIMCHHSGSTISHCTISGNTATEKGGGICFAGDSYPSIEDCIIEGNDAVYIGGGISCFYIYTIIINNCTISANTSDMGGGISCFEFNPTISNCAIYDNSVIMGFGGGICIGDCIPTITNCTISSNMAEYEGGGIFCSESRSIGVNNIIWANTAYSDSQICLSDVYSHFDCSFSDIQDGWPGEGNIEAEPMFYSISGDSAFFLTEGSPCIDAGDPNSPLDPDSTIADMGAYYFDQTIPQVDDLTVRVDFLDIVLDWTAIPFASSYNIYRSGTPYFDIYTMTPIASVNENTFIDSAAVGLAARFYAVTVVE